MFPAALARLVGKLVLEFHQPLTVTAAAQVHDFIVMLASQLVEDILLGLHRHLFLHLAQFVLSISLTPHDVELASAALALWVHLVVQAGSTQGATLMKQAWTVYLGRNGIVWSARSQHLSLGSILAVGVAALNHKVLDDTMKKSAVEVSFLSQFYEVVTMTRSLVVEAHDDVALCSLDFYC